MRKPWIAAGVVGVAALAVIGDLSVGEDRDHPAETAATPQSSPAPESSAQAPVLLADATVAAELYPDDKVLGSADAPITIIEYASLTCPHCAAFHAQVLPQLKTEHIDKGEVRLVYRDFPLDGAGLQAAQLARCAPDDKRYFGLIDTLFKLQGQWSSASDPTAALTQIGALAGMNKETVDACFANEELNKTIITRRQEAEAKFGVRSTPTFVINGQVYTGGQTLEMLQEIFKEQSSKS